MNNRKSKQEYAEMYDDAFAALIVSNYAEKQGDELKQAADAARQDPSFIPTKQQRNQFMKMLQASEKKAARADFLRAGKKFSRVAVITVTVASLAFMVPLATVEAFRVKVMNLYLDIKKQYTEIAPEIPEEDAEGLPTYIPEGFVLTVSTKTMGELSAQYECGDQNFFYSRGSLAARVRIDTENADIVTTTEINGNKALFVEKDGVASFTWYDSQHCYSLMGVISSDELKKVAESIK